MFRERRVTIRETERLPRADNKFVLYCLFPPYERQQSCNQKSKGCAALSIVRTSSSFFTTDIETYHG